MEKAWGAAQQVLLSGVTGPTAHKLNGLYLLETNDHGRHETYSKADDPDVLLRQVNARCMMDHVNIGQHMGYLIQPADGPPPMGSNPWKLRVDIGSVARDATWEGHHVSAETLDADQARKRAQSAGQRIIIRQARPSGAHRTSTPKPETRGCGFMAAASQDG